MSASTGSRTSPLSRLILYLQHPLHRNGYALVLSSAATSAIGVIYWVLAARLYSPVLVGVNSAAISAMMFLGGVAQLNLTSALIRFIPASGRLTLKLVIIVYGAALAVALVAGALFLASVDRWAPALHFMDDNRVIILWFIASTAIWTIFVLQDAILTGLRHATWVPVENTAYALVKVTLLVILAASLPTFGIFASWTAALIVAILPTNYFLFVHLIPSYIRRTHSAEPDYTPRQVVRFAAADYLGALFWLLSTTFLPVLVTIRIGATANAYFYLAWTIAYSLYLIGPNIGSAMIVETSDHMAQLGEYSWKAFLQAVQLIVPAVIVLLAAAPYILDIFGRSYSVESALLLRLLALSAIPNAVNAIYISVARVQRDMRTVVVTLGVLCGSVILLSLLLMPLIGILGVGIAWLVSQTVIAAVVYQRRLRSLWKHAAVLPAPHGNRAWPGYLPRRVRHALYVMARLAQRSSLVRKILIFLHVPADRYTRWRRKASLQGELAPVLEAISPLPGMPPPRTWVIHRHISTVTDMDVSLLGPVDGLPVAILKIPHSRSRLRSVQSQADVLEILQGISQLNGFKRLLPAILGEGRLAGHTFFVETLIPGVSGRTFIEPGEPRFRFQADAARAISGLHQQTGISRVVDDPMLESLIDQPVYQVERVLQRLRGEEQAGAMVRRLRERLYAAVRSQRVMASWVHGDYVPGNILVSPESERVTGIVDWELAQPDGLPLLDLLQLFLSIQMQLEGRELGDIVREYLLGKSWEANEMVLINQVRRSLPSGEMTLQDLILLTWLKHVAANIRKTDQYTYHLFWAAGNLDPVLEAL